ncbi:MAG TPA: BTAD domain-containing putative transcriptional regulator [Solirubrobacteraceae bacterium]|nr:BTAD domain-containing putative transcriptional regulator [Solirubrobacteraceae bacterium]
MDFRILGPLEVVSDGQPVDLAGHKQRVLLTLLLLEANRVVPRDRLVDALWDEAPPETAHKALQVHVSQLRKALGADRIETRAPGYRLRVEAGELDRERFEQLQAEGRPEAALSLWRGPALADVAGERFAEADAARLEDLRLRCVEERVEQDLARGLHAELTGELEALAREHPRRERLSGQLMLCLYRSGRQAEALDVYRQARETLVEDLGIEPGRELRDLHQAILEQDPSLDAAPAAVGPARGDLVGRERELAALTEGLDDALAGRGRLFLLAGEPGIGKSRLAEELAERARDRGARVLVGRCWEAGGAPAFWPWVQALRECLHDADRATLHQRLGGSGADLATILPELRELVPDIPAAPSHDGEGARFRLLEAVTSFLRGVAASRPLVVVLDDLHAADAPSLLLLRFVATQLTGSPILIAGCYRDTEVGPDLEEALAELSRASAVQRIALKGLSAPETAQLLALAMRETPAGELAARVQAGTHGNPLFATEIGRLLATEDSAEGTSTRLPIPDGVRETIRQRLQRESDRCREVLELASAIGRDFDPDVVGRVSGLDEEGLLRALDEAVAARLLDGAPGTSGRLRFSHILVRDTLYEELPASRRLSLHRAIGEALEALYAGNPEPHLAELARHYLAGGPSVAQKAAHYAQGAGDQAAGQHGYEEAARHYSSALRLVETTGSDDDRTRELLLSLGEVLSRAGRDEEAKTTLRRAATLAERAGRSDQLARAALQYGGRFAWARASTDAALVPMLERALQALGDEDRAARARLLARLAAALRDEPLRDRRVLLAEEALEIAEGLGDPLALAAAIEGHWVAVEGPEQTGESIAVGGRLIALAEQTGDKERVFAGHDHRLHGFWMVADRAGVDVELDALAALADELRQTPQRWHVGTGRAMLALMEGRFEVAEALIAETAALGRSALSWNSLVTERLAHFVLRREQGRLAEVEDTLRRSVHEYPALLRFRCALVHLYGELGREREARAAFDEVLSRDPRRHHLDAEWLFSMSLLADPCAFLGDREAAQMLYAVLLPYERLYAQAPVEVSFGSVARSLGVLATVLEHFDDAERHFDAAAETERAMRARPWLAHVHEDHARMLLRRGGPDDVARAGQLLEQAATTYRELGMDGYAARATAQSPSSMRSMR